MRIFVEYNCGTTKALLRLAFPDAEFTNVAERAELIIFTGGEDVSPSLYKHPNIASGCNRTRDDNCIKIWDDGIANGAKFMGICRGAQFVNVMLGGTMWQHIGTHPYLHTTDTGLQINSTHHQGIVPNECLGEILHRPSFDHAAVTPDGVIRGVRNVESFRNEDCFCVQWHPEFMKEDCAAVQWWIIKAQELMK